MIEVIETMRRATKRPLWAKPNAGMPELVKGKTVFSQTPAQMARHLPHLIQAGASHVGGCCGTTPDHIRVMVREARNLVAMLREYMDVVAKGLIRQTPLG